MSRIQRPHDAAAKQTLAMSGAQYGERGGTAAMRASTTFPDELDAPVTTPSSKVNSSSTTSSQLNNHDSSRSHNLEQGPSHVDARNTSTNTNNKSFGGAKLALSPQDDIARSELLRESVFPDWKDDASGYDISSPDEMQKKDPLATQIWKLYSKTKTQLPNQERMENLTWRMMAMSLKRKEREQARWVFLHELSVVDAIQKCFIYRDWKLIMH